LLEQIPLVTSVTVISVPGERSQFDRELRAI